MANLKDVARLSGVSVTTVSRVLNNRGYISEQTRNKVYAAIKTLNYQPNELARSLLRKRSNIIGLIVPSLDHPFFCRLAQAIEFYASLHDIKIMLCVSYRDPQKEIEYLKMLKSNKVDGIILSSRSIEIHEQLDFSFPFVTIDRILDEKIPCISCDHYQGGTLATEHLIDKGCKHLAHISGSQALKLMANRRDEAFIDVCRKRNISYRVFSTKEDHFSDMDYYDIISSVLADKQIDGIFAGSDVIAMQIIQAALKQNIKIPDHLRIVGYDNIRYASLIYPSITTIHQPIDEIGKYSIESILNQRNGHDVPIRTVLPVRLIERDTT